MRSLLVTILVVLPLAQVAFGDDIQPPPWRGQPSTTSQIWEFMTPITPVAPDGPAPGGQPPLPSTMISVEPGPGMDWMQEDEGRLGVWPLSGRMDVVVDNHNPPNLFKLVWVQITWRPQDPGEKPILIDFDPPLPPGMVPERVDAPLQDPWIESTFKWELRPNPPDERFAITGTINVDEVVIDTWCIPEPASLLLLGLGTLTLVRRRK